MNKSLRTSITLMVAGILLAVSASASAAKGPSKRWVKAHTRAAIEQNDKVDEFHRARLNTAIQKQFVEQNAQIRELKGQIVQLTAIMNAFPKGFGDCPPDGFVNGFRVQTNSVRPECGFPVLDEQDPMVRVKRVQSIVRGTHAITVAARCPVGHTVITGNVNWGGLPQKAFEDMRVYEVGAMVDTTASQQIPKIARDAPVLYGLRVYWPTYNTTGYTVARVSVEAFCRPDDYYYAEDPAAS